MKKQLEYGMRCLLLLALLVGLAGCTNPLDRFTATDEPGINGEITIYTPLYEEQTTPYLRLFRAKYPNIQINLVLLDNSQIYDRLLAERDEPQADVLWGLSATMVALLEWQDVLIPYAPEGLQRIYPQFRDSNNPPYWVGFGAWMSAFCVNMELLESLDLPKPESWINLFDPIYAEQIALPSPMTSDTGYMITIAMLEFYGEIQGWENLDALDKNVKIYTTSSEESCAMAAQGEVAIGVSYDLAALESAAAGEPVEAVFATEGAGWDIETNALVRKDEMREVSKLFLDWAISDEAMQAYSESRALLGMPLEGHTPPAGFPQEPLQLIYDKDFPWASANWDRITTEWLKRYGGKLGGQ